MKRIIIVAMILILSMCGCSKEASKDSVLKVEEKNELEKNIPMADSSKEKWHIYNEEEREEIRLLGKKYEKYANGSEFILAYYEYYDLQDTKLPVVIGMSYEEAEEKYGGEWIDIICKIRFEESEKMPDEWAYGILSAEQISALVLADEPRYSFVARDLSIPNVAESIDGKTMKEVWGVNSSINSLLIYNYRYCGVISFSFDAEGFVFRRSPLSGKIMY